MKKSNITKFAVVAITLGVLSPSVKTNNTQTAQDTTVLVGSIESIFSMDQMSLSLFNEAEARRVVRRSSSRRSVNVRRSNYRHGGYHGGHHGGGYYRRPYVAPAAAGVVTGMAVGAAIATPSCYVRYINGLRYRDCGDGLYRY